MAITVTNVVGMTETQAREALSGLTIQVVYSSDSTKQNGVVLSQSAAEGTKLTKGATITLTVNQISTTDPNDEPEEPTTPEEPSNPPTNETTGGSTNTILTNTTGSAE